MSEKVKVPNIGDFKEVEIIEVLVKNGDKINKGDPIITLESDKSSVEVPSPYSGKILNINIKIGDKVSEGDTVLVIESVENKIETKTIVIKIVSTWVDLIAKPSFSPVISLNSPALIKNFCPSKNLLSAGPIIILTTAWVTNIIPILTIAS